MADFSEYPLAGPEKMQILDSLMRTTRYHNIQYGNVTLSGTELADAYDPDTQVRVTHFAVQWPGANPFPDGGATSDFFRTPAIPPDTMRIRQIILGASIGESALRRSSQNIDDMRLFDNLNTGIGAAMLEEVLHMSEAPLGVIQIGIVTRSRALRSGDTMAHLWHPVLMRPARALERLQSTVRRMIQEEIVPDS